MRGGSFLRDTPDLRVTQELDPLVYPSTQKDMPLADPARDEKPANEVTLDFTYTPLRSQ